MKSLALAVLFLFTCARAGGGGLIPPGVPASQVSTLRCQSGRTIQTFSPNTQSIRLIYRGELRVLMYVPIRPGQDVMHVGVRYSDIARPGDRIFDLPAFGTGLEWRSFQPDRQGSSLQLYRVHQDKTGHRRLTLLERCHE